MKYRAKHFRKQDDWSAGFNNSRSCFRFEAQHGRIELKTLFKALVKEGMVQGPRDVCRKEGTLPGFIK